MNNLTAYGALGGGFWGMLIGAIFLNPLLGFAIGGAAGAVSGALSDIGIDDKFMKQLADQMKPGTSTLFILLHSDLSDKALAELKGTGGTILQTSLASEDEEKLRKAISETKTEIKSPYNHIIFLFDKTNKKIFSYSYPLIYKNIRQT